MNGTLDAFRLTMNYRVRFFFRFYYICNKKMLIRNRFKITMRFQKEKIPAIVLANIFTKTNLLLNTRLRECGAAFARGLAVCT